ncbi:hypothetical protein L207DRAFT_580641 [Hyaloscypha variabilis F]|uniref:Uncharacterized protein n=1 Tax=Hyaloscypha variabilis (strain UAMH 11265 / GT02V1 / F) TaxID=1149755 RepID=A0A2J6RTW4_HYAVF|nr:hypothetical protein L207DRAFT_580641 [Hyaloscypha variabilis F]
MIDGRGGSVCRYEGLGGVKYLNLPTISPSRCLHRYGSSKDSLRKALAGVMWRGGQIFADLEGKEDVLLSIPWFPNEPDLGMEAQLRDMRKAATGIRHRNTPPGYAIGIRHRNIPIMTLDHLLFARESLKQRLSKTFSFAAFPGLLLLGDGVESL